MLRYSFLAAPLLMVLVLTARGADSSAAACGGIAPWILDEALHAAVEGGESSAGGLDAVTYNLHSGFGSRWTFYRGRAAIERNLRHIAASIAAAAAGGPDVVALNEVDFASRRSGWIDQAQFIADRLEVLTGNSYRVFRGETWRRDLPGFEVRFGNAALVRLPVIEAQACRFDRLDDCGLAAASAPAAPARRGSLLGRLLREPRGVIRVSVELDGRPVDVLVTHLEAVDMNARETQARVLAERVVRPGRTTILLGDMNAVPISLTRSRWLFSEDRTHAILALGSLADASILFASNRRQTSLATWATYPAEGPIWGLDWVLGSLDLVPQAVAAIGTTASDHRGLHVRYRCLRDDAEVRALQRRHGEICERFRAYDATCSTAAN